MESKAVLPCVTLGNPKPDVTWLKDDELIKVCALISTLQTGFFSANMESFLSLLSDQRARYYSGLRSLEDPQHPEGGRGPVPLRGQEQLRFVHFEARHHRGSGYVFTPV